jgi:hypothetical protein
VTLVGQPSVDVALSPLLVEALAFEAPYVIERLVNDRIVASVPEAEELFTEVKRYLVMSEVCDDVVVGMCSARVDEAWHAFILYTSQYADFCQRYFGHFIGHAPKNAPKAGADPHGHRRELSFPEFCTRYEELFGELLPEVWLDPRNVVVGQRVFNDEAGELSIARSGSAAELIDASGDVLVSVNDIAVDALAFIAVTGAFYVRELPGGLTDREKVALVEALLTIRTLRLAS